MGVIQKDAFRTMMLSYLGLILGYVNKGVLFIIFLTTDQVGLVNLLISVGLLFAQFANLGSVYATWKFFPFFRNPNKKNYGFLLLTTLIVCFGALIFSIVSIALKGVVSDYYYEKSKMFVDYYYWIIPIGIANVFFMLFESYLKGLYQNLLPVFSYELLLRLLITALLGIYGFGGMSFNLFLVLHCLVYFIPTIILAVYLIRIKELHFSLSSITVPARFKKIMLRFSMLSYVNTLGALIVTTMDAMMITYMLGLEATGVYTTVIYLTSALQIPYKSLIRVSSTLIPVYWKENNMKAMENLYRRVSSICLVTGIFMFMMVWINREELFGFLPAEYHEGIWVFLFLMVGRLLDMYFGLNGSIFITSKKYKYDIVFTVSLMAIVFVLNLFFIPAYGVTGAAISTGLAYVVYNTGRLLFVYFVYGLHPFSWSQCKVIALFAVNILLFELLPPVFGYPVADMALKSVIFLCSFGGVTYWFNLEPEIKGYVRKGILFVRQKSGIGRSSVQENEF